MKSCWGKGRQASRGGPWAGEGALAPVLDQVNQLDPVPPGSGQFCKTAPGPLSVRAGQAECLSMPQNAGPGAAEGCEP